MPQLVLWPSCVQTVVWGLAQKLLGKGQKGLPWCQLPMGRWRSRERQVCFAEQKVLVQHCRLCLTHGFACFP